MCGLRVDGSLACWSQRDNDPAAVLSPPAGVFESVSVGVLYACAIRVGGQVACWGEETPGYSFGQASPPDGSFRSVATNWLYSCGLRTDGEVECWGLREDRERRLAGWNSDGGLWPQGPFSAFDISQRETARICAMRPSGEITCWNDGSGTHRAPGGEFVALDAGSTASCGLRPNGDATCWGFEFGWEYPDRPLPLAWDVPEGPFAAISVGDGYACALRPDGEAACWGRGKLSKRTRNDESLEERENRRRLEPPPGPFTAISAFDEFTCGLHPNGDTACWGMHSASTGRTLASPPAGPFTTVQAGDRQACGLRPNGDARCWFSSSGRRTAGGEETAMPDGAFAALISGEAAPWWLRPGGELACGDPDDDLARDAPDMSFRSIAAMNGHFCGLDFQGEIACWSSAGPIWHEPTPPGPFTAVTVGSDYSCGLRPNGEAECWTPHWPPGADPVPTTATTSAGRTPP